MEENFKKSINSLRDEKFSIESSAKVSFSMIAMILMILMIR